VVAGYQPPRKSSRARPGSPTSCSARSIAEWEELGWHELIYMSSTNGA
jgi:hypothetical protein